MGTMANHPEEDVVVEESTTDSPQLKEPPRYAVILHNDDYTTFDFVVEVLQRFFRKNLDEATQITLKVHHEGRGVAGIYTLEIAETKATQVGEYAQSRGFPLRCSVEQG